MTSQLIFIPFIKNWAGKDKWDILKMDFRRDFRQKKNKKKQLILVGVSPDWTW